MKIISLAILIIVLMVAGCTGQINTPEAGELNAKASLPAGFNFSKMGLKVITSTINKKLGTMATLYGNDAAKATALAGNSESLPTSVFALVTWKQQADKRWIGGNIPGDLLSVEMLKATGDKHNTALYTRFNDPGLAADPDTSGNSGRIRFILSLKPSIMF